MATRIISLVLAFVFFVSTVGFSVFVIIESRQDGDDNEAATTSATDQTEQPTQGGENMLEGTTLTGFTPLTDRVADLQIEDTVVGEGAAVAEGATVTVHYTGALVSDGTIFQSSKDFGDPITFGLNGLIQGWQEGIPGMKVGGTRRLVIPAEKAYGAAGSPPSIPGDADLVFDIELISIAE